MALSWLSVSSSSSLPLLHLHSSIPKPFFYPPRTSLFSLSTSISTAPNSYFPSLSTISCSTNSNSNSISASAIDDSPPPTVFIKGLSLSTSEGRLKRAFSEFGEVTRVKILIDTFSGQSLGFAYVWFAKEHFGQLAIRQMNGKFFHGRYIFVGKPRQPRKRKTMSHYKF
ncbi:organelle RRM domain-containing protein 2, mitochondrial [Humulus lupulus]|uniref:organelle RRM domain-containing protein 2, mitochondrial n=1 Tax=Humulus lupulus TaxID=3486 RepID=UPI002B4173B7|nr:organelle RRM domain-containing protein 2, mitochondrial [Humulus lupulus]